MYDTARCRHAGPSVMPKHKNGLLSIQMCRYTSQHYIIASRNKGFAASKRIDR